MPLVRAQLQFASEFVTLVVTASALALLLLRPQPRRFAVFGDGPDLSPGRVALAFLSGIALAALAGAAFAHGSVLVQGHDAVWLGFGRVVASLVLLLAFPYPRENRNGEGAIGGVLLRIGFMAWLGAGVAELASGPAYLIDALLAAGSVLTAGALLRLARRSIVVRVAASGAVSLLLVVIILALSLSAVISSKLQSQEVGRLSARSAVEKSVLTDTTAVASDAQSLEAILTTSFAQPIQNPLSEFAAGSPTAWKPILARFEHPSADGRLRGGGLLRSDRRIDSGPGGNAAEQRARVRAPTGAPTAELLDRAAGPVRDRRGRMARRLRSGVHYLRSAPRCGHRGQPARRRFTTRRDSSQAELVSQRGLADPSGFSAGTM